MDARLTLDQPIEECRLFMVFDGRWKYVHAVGFRPMLFDLASDPPNSAISARIRRFAAERARLREALLEWALRDHKRITMPDARIARYAAGAQLEGGIVIGYRDEAELAAERARLGPRLTAAAESIASPAPVRA